MSNSPSVTSQFVKTLGPSGVFLLTMSALSPVLSVYVGGSAIVQMAGTGAAVAFIIGGLVAAALSLLFAELGAAFPRAGGIYPTIAGAMGPAWSYGQMIVVVVFSPATVAFAAVGVGQYAHFLAPSLGVVAVALGALAVACGVALLRIRLGAIVTGLFLGVEMLGLAVLSVIALTHPQHALADFILHPVMLRAGAIVPTPLPVLALATVAGASMASGASWAMCFAEEMQGAQARMGRIIAWIGLLAAIVIVGPLLLWLAGIRDIAGTMAAEAPIAFYLTQTAGPEVATAVGWGVVIAVFNALIALVLALSRVLYATGRDGVWPMPINRLLSSLSSRLATPVVATVILGLASAGACLLSQRTLVVLTSGDVFTTLMVSLAVYVGRRRGVTGAHFASPWFPLFPLVGVIFVIGSAWSNVLDKDAGRPSILLLGGVFVSALAYDAWRRRSGDNWKLAPLIEAEDLKS